MSHEFRTPLNSILALSRLLLARTDGQTSAAFTSARGQVAALEGGADSYLVEPIEPDELVAAVKMLLRMRRAEQELRRLNETLEARVAERTHELAETNRRLEAESAQRRKAEEVLWHAQKLEAVGQLTGGLAHDFNNLLTVISGNIELVGEALSGERALTRERSLHLIRAAEKAADRGARLTRQLLAFSRRSVLSTQTVDLNDLISSFDDFLRRALGDAIALEIAYAPDLRLCRLDGVQFEAAMLNLVVNARDAMPAGGTLRIETSNLIVEDAGPGDAGGPKPGAYVRIRVADNGVGMAPETVRRAFEPFFTTKEVGKGSGLGLSQVYGFVKQSGGHVAIESAPGAGTVFIFHLPAWEGPTAVEDRDAERLNRLPMGHETILIVEDDVGVRAIAATMVRDLGYKVIEAADACQALALIRAGGPIDLVFSDIAMPGGMSGFDLAKQARAHGLKVLLTSGYPAAERGEMAGVGDVLVKPYRRGDLARRIRSALALAAAAHDAGR